MADSILGAVVVGTPLLTWALCLLHTNRRLRADKTEVYRQLEVARDLNRQALRRHNELHSQIEMQRIRLDNRKT